MIAREATHGPVSPPTASRDRACAATYPEAHKCIDCSEDGADTRSLWGADFTLSRCKRMDIFG